MSDHRKGLHHFQSWDLQLRFACCFRPQSLPAPVAGPRPFHSGPQGQQAPGPQPLPAPGPHPQLIQGPRPQDPRQLAHPQPQPATFDPRQPMLVQVYTQLVMSGIPSDKVPSGGQRSLRSSLCLSYYCCCRRASDASLNGPTSCVNIKCLHRGIFWPTIGS